MAVSAGVACRELAPMRKPATLQASSLVDDNGASTEFGGGVGVAGLVVVDHLVGGLVEDLDPELVSPTAAIDLPVGARFRAARLPSSTAGLYAQATAVRALGRGCSDPMRAPAACPRVQNGRGLQSPKRCCLLAAAFSTAWNLEQLGRALDLQPQRPTEGLVLVWPQAGGAAGTDRRLLPGRTSSCGRR